MPENHNCGRTLFRGVLSLKSLMDTLNDPQRAVKFTQEQLAMIDQGLAEFERGEGMSAEEALELARQRTRAWMDIAPQNLSA